MDELSKRILLEITESDKLIFLFELCGVVKINDIMEVNDETLNKMEKYIYNFLSHETNAYQYLDPLFVYQPPDFLFSPGLRLKILRAVKRIQEESRMSCAFKEEKIISNSEMHYKDVSYSKSFYDDSKKKLIHNEDSCIEKDIFPQSTSNYNEIIRKKREILAMWSQNVIERVSKKFTDVKLEYKEDFDLDIKIQKTEAGPKCSGVFLCHFCRNLKGQTKSIKFSVSKENYVILSNVITHLKLHFSPSEKLVCLPTR